MHIRIWLDYASFDESFVQARICRDVFHKGAFDASKDLWSSMILRKNFESEIFQPFLTIRKHICIYAYGRVSKHKNVVYAHIHVHMYIQIFASRYGQTLAFPGTRGWKVGSSIYCWSFETF